MLTSTHAFLGDTILISKGGINLSGKTSHQLYWIIYGISFAFLVQVMYDFFGEPVFTAIMPKQWWGIIMTTVFLSMMTIWTWRSR